MLCRGEQRPCDVRKRRRAWREQRVWHGRVKERLEARGCIGSGGDETEELQERIAGAGEEDQRQRRSSARGLGQIVATTAVAEREQPRMRTVRRVNRAAAQRRGGRRARGE